MSDVQTIGSSIAHDTGDSTIVSYDAVDSYKVDAAVPSVVVFPQNIEHIEAILRSANSYRTPVIPWGGGTRIHTGNVAESYTIAVDLNSLDYIEEYEPADLTIITGAGMTIAKLNEVLIEKNQFIPLNPPNPEKATIGGILASNAYGYLRDTYGTVRDMALGLRFVRADGTQIKGGGKVSKNVAGYDLTRLMTGSWGTLGIISEVALRVRPLPETKTTLIAGFGKLSSAAAAASDVLNAFYAPTFTLLLNRQLAGKIAAQTGIDIGEIQYLLVIGMDGLSETVRWQEEEIKKTCRRNHVTYCNLLPGNASHQMRDFLQNYTSSEYDGAICKFVTTRTGSVGLLKLLQETKNIHELAIEIVSYSGSGVVYVLVPFISKPDESTMNRVIDFVSEIQSHIRRSNGFCILQHAPSWLKARCPVRQNFPGEMLMRKLKKQLDPNNILNPERFIRSV